MSEPTTLAVNDIPRMRARRGFAMALALGAIVVIGMLIGGAFFVSSQQARNGRGSMWQELAFRHAEGGLAQTITTWDPDSTSGLTAGQSWIQSAVPLPDVANPKLYPRVTVTRLNNDLFQVMSEASIGSSGGARAEATRRVSQIVRLVGPAINIRGALTVRGQTKIGGSSLINGNDQNPSNWSCDAPGAALPGIAIPDPSMISTSGCSNYSCVTGSPKVQTDPVAAADSTYFKFGEDFDWDGLVSMADIVMTFDAAPAPVVTNGKCDFTPVTNWGDPNHVGGGACTSYYPIIYYPGNANLTGGTGQGILLVEGDLSVAGLFKFYGPVIVRGRLKTAGTGGHFSGAVMAANVDLEENTLLGNAVVNYSACAVEKAVQAAGRAKPVIQRGWTEMF